MINHKSNREMSEFMQCNCKHHRPAVTKYPKDKVPIKMFFKDPDDISKGFYKLCKDCREYGQASKNKTKQKGKESRELVKNGESEFLFCEYPSHSHYSIYERNKVPKELFLNTDSKNEFYKFCLNCREHFREYNSEIKERIKEQAITDGKFFCGRCNKIKSKEEMAINKDGKPSKHCVPCKADANEYNLKRRICYNNIRLEFIEKYGCSCQRCKKIYLKPIDNTFRVRELDTYEKDGTLMVNFEGKIYVAQFFVIYFKNLLETRIIDLDHLSEKEQRDRGILKPSDPYIGKIERVCMLGGEDAMRKEAKKCQNLCKKCHVLVTIEREIGIRGYTYLERKKKEYVDNFKSGGCTSCGFLNEVLRLFHLDHIDPEFKINHISQMVSSDKYSLEDVIYECKKTRVLCIHCHTIHTCIQKGEGKIM